MLTSAINALVKSGDATVISWLYNFVEKPTFTFIQSRKLIIEGAAGEQVVLTGGKIHAKLTKSDPSISIPVSTQLLRFCSHGLEVEKLFWSFVAKKDRPDCFVPPFNLTSKGICFRVGKTSLSALSTKKYSIVNKKAGGRIYIKYTPALKKELLKILGRLL